MHFTVNKFDFLVALYIFCILVSELMGGKTFPLIAVGPLNVNASVAILLLPLIFSINDVITEVYGPERARSLIRSGLCMIGFLIIFSLIATALPPSVRFKNSEATYDAVFKVSARIAAASLIAFATADFLDVAIFVHIRNKMGKRGLWLRNNVSNFVAQLLDTTLFMVLAFYAVDTSFTDNMSFLISLIIPYWLLKCSMSVIETPLVYLGIKWLKGEQKA